jgi:hypothetical protein
VGNQEEQAKDELREAVERTEVRRSNDCLRKTAKEGTRNCTASAGNLKRNHRRSTFHYHFRYYYDKNIILKTAGKRYVYRFVCDLQGLLGYSPEEIHQMVDLKIEKKEED